MSSLNHLDIVLLLLAAAVLGVAVGLWMSDLGAGSDIRFAALAIVPLLTIIVNIRQHKRRENANG
ncbi:hypothetical protein [Erythrobacter sp. F6033]|uniref:hypothetical protein n=1 Tax=Erythrobacter sp. F6033 TaxID=2926401 RepID=UPI001FF4A876|nr:hypothetical protein [Erythrobacter sp. F6033]MCK0128279.1 hypothetical protein [Erythrobacter sp. F6033]